jgi:bifunctional ADP-heptose synthase (sugar kinase/adenylyltransferase)
VKRREASLGKVVYSYYVLDIIHDGHLEMMMNSKAVAGMDGLLIVGILTDEAVLEKKPAPTLSFGQRYRLAKSLAFVDVVVAQTTYSPIPNVLAIRPDVLMESGSHTEEAIQEARGTMASIGGTVIVIPYYPGESSTAIKERVRGSSS